MWIKFNGYTKYNVGFVQIVCRFELKIQLELYLFYLFL